MPFRGESLTPWAPLCKMEGLERTSSISMCISLSIQSPMVLENPGQFSECDRSVFFNIILLPLALSPSVRTDQPQFLLLRGHVSRVLMRFLSLSRHFPRPLDFSHSGVVMAMTSSEERCCSCCHGYKDLLMRAPLHCHHAARSEERQDLLASLNP